jgi:hypothetical protein
LLKAPVVGLDFPSHDRLGFCETCAFCISKVQDIPRAPADRDVSVFEVVGVDFCSPMSVPSLGGRHYNFGVVDFCSRYMLHDALRTKDEANTSFRRMLATITSMGHNVRRVRVDNDAMFLGQEFRSLLDEFNISLKITVPYAHWQHGRIERHWGTLVPIAQSMVRHAGLPKSYWALAMSATIHIRNRVISTGVGGIPYEIVTGRRVDLHYMRVFGCPAYVHIDKSRRHKLGDCAWKGVFVGYALNSPAWLVYNPGTCRVISCRNVTFNEAIVLSMGEECSHDNELHNIFREVTRGNAPETCEEEPPLHPDMTVGEPQVEHMDEASGETESGSRYSVRSTKPPQRFVHGSKAPKELQSSKPP